MMTMILASELSSAEFILADESRLLENEEKSIFSPPLGSLSATQKKNFFLLRSPHRHEKLRFIFSRIVVAIEKHEQRIRGNCRKVPENFFN
jgi:hypothetical protein